jgi:hypothetical protein
VGCGWTVTAVSTGFAGVETAGVGTEGVGAGCAPLGCGGAAADLVFAILLGAGEEDLALLLAEAEVRAGVCEAGAGATGAGGCGLLAGAGAGLGFLAGLGVGVDFALAVTAGAADTATDGDATGAVSETVRTTGASAGVETGLVATAKRLPASRWDQRTEANPERCCLERSPLCRSRHGFSRTLLPGS